jgi:histidyl-tRNA synthetase
MRDLLPEEVLQRRELLERILGVYEQFGYQQIETPALEELDRLLGSEGGDNEKLIYKVLKRGIEEWPPASEVDAVDLGLRYDLTVTLARFFASHSHELLSPFRAIQVGSVWRAERPQKGRYRQFTQCDIDILGEPGPMAEVELLASGAEALRAAGLSDFVIRINDRRILRSLVEWAGFDPDAEAAVLVAVDKLDKIGVEGVAEQLALVDDDGAASRKLADLMPLISEARGLDGVLAALPVDVDSTVRELELIIDGVREMAAVTVEFLVDPTLVRGQGYYTGPIWEVEVAGSPGSVASGGRYDRMVGKLSGIDVPAAGFSIGFERIWDLVADQLETEGGQRVALLYGDGVSIADIGAAARSLRESATAVRIERAAKNRNGQLARLAAAGFTHWVEFRPELPAVQQIRG